MAYFSDPIECPECGYHTCELSKATSRASGQRVLMCENCFTDSEEGLEGWEDDDE